MAELVTVIGAGAWGTTLAVRLAQAGTPVLLWAHTADARAELATARENRRYLPGIAFPDQLRVASSDEDLAQPARLVILAVPSAHVRATLGILVGGASAPLAGDAAVLSVVKGIEPETHLRMSEVIGEVLPQRPVAVLSGPNLAREIAAGKPAASVLACGDPALARDLAGLLSDQRLRIYTNPDVLGVELCGALKNVVALAAGMVDGLALGDSAKAGIITRGLAEMTRLGVAAGAEPGTFAGLAGVGDLIATCMSPISRNRQAGELLASGLPLADVEARLSGVAEGVTTVRGALALAATHGAELPIAEQVDAVIHQRRAPLEAVAALMGRSLRDELS